MHHSPTLLQIATFLRKESRKEKQFVSCLDRIAVHSHEPIKRDSVNEYANRSYYKRDLLSDECPLVSIVQ